MRVRVLDTRLNNERYMDMIKQTEADMDLNMCRSGDVVFTALEDGAAGLLGGDVGMTLVNVDELMKFGSNVMMEFRNSLYTGRGIVFNIREDALVRNFRQGGRLYGEG